MPLADGYSRSTVAENMRELREAGESVQAAAAIALSRARAAYFKRWPKGALPSWLAYPKKYRLASHYDREGRALYVGADESPVKENPSLRSEIAQGAALQAAFSGHPTRQIRKIRQKTGSNVRVEIGPVLGVIYATRRDGKEESYIHRFAKGSRPLLTATPDGKRLELLGGAFNFTERGIVDRRKRTSRRRAH